MPYIDGFLLTMKKSKVAAYQKMSRRAGRIWRQHGALEYRECVGDDLKQKMGRPFSRAAAAKPGEVVVFSWIVYKSRAHRDRVNRLVMSDPRIVKMIKAPMPFDVKRMSYAGFRVIVDV